ncbi:Crp/Fnr family transcriptional regulator [Chelativorans sp. YIM 93263]|uniref:Crp/Fnr family transcriptional regulator n=1 Tax=Chelativorans sp. YIM 93263 TaxID=2906648 RepID=UPI0023799D5C|nr:Crp/Fnr family transcriptional regulator [Chelativorans sp. YIM 93263]
MSIKDEIAREALWASELTPEEMERARHGLVERVYPKGSYVCHRGDRLDHWTGVREGLVKISAISAAGKAMTFAGMAGGSWFGEGSVLKDEPRQYDVVAIRDTRLALMPRSTFMWLFENSTGFNRYLVRQLNERLGQFIASVEYDRILDPKARVARNLSWFFNPVLCPNVKNEIEISQEELALLAGVSRQVVNRALQGLQEEGLLRAEHGRITVFKPEALSRYDV